MESQRQQKFARLIQKEVGEIFQRDTKSLFGKAFITVTNVFISPDLALAKIYLSIMLAKNNEEMMDLINENKSKIRNILGQKIRHQARVIPELAFFLDESAEYASKMDKIISDLDIPPAPEEDKEEDEE